MFSVSLYNIMSFHFICHIFNFSCIPLHPVYFQIHVSSSWTVEDVTTKYVTNSVLLTSLPDVGLRVASRAGSASPQHSNIRILDFHRLERAYFVGDRGALGRSFLVLVSVHILVVQLCLLQWCLLLKARHTIVLIHMKWVKILFLCGYCVKTDLKFPLALRYGLSPPSWLLTLLMPVSFLSILAWNKCFIWLGTCSSRLCVADRT